MARLAPEPVRRWRNSPIHREVDGRRSWWVGKFFVGLAVAAIPFGLYVVQTMAYVETSYALEGLRAQHSRLQEAEHRLRIEEATLESLPAVQARATRDLGLVHPPPGHAVVVAPGELVHPSAVPRPTARTAAR